VRAGTGRFGGRPGVGGRRLLGFRRGGRVQAECGGSQSAGLSGLKDLGG